MAVDETNGCSCCAEVTKKMPLKYRYANALEELPNKTLEKDLPVFGCPVCDKPMMALARSNDAG